MSVVVRGAPPRSFVLPPRARGALLFAIVLVSLLLGYVLSSAPMELLKPRRWDDLFSGLGGGLLVVSHDDAFLARLQLTAVIELGADGTLTGVS